MIALILVALAAVVAYCLLVLACPQVPCPRCLGRRVTYTATSRGKRRPRKCRSCRGIGLTRLPGATLVHRMFWAVWGEQIRERRKQENAERLTARQEKAS